MTELKERNDVTPICPNCSESLPEIWCRQLRARLGKRYVYFCLHCRKVLGISHRKGFFMG